MPPKSGFAPKVRVLQQNETQGTFDTWKETLLFNLSLEGTFEFILDDEFKWKGHTHENRGLRADSGSEGMTAKQKATTLSMLLGTIASYAPVISRQFITQEATCLNDIWHRLRIFYGFRKSGALILDLPTFHLEEGESHESLWERLHAFIMDNLVHPSDGLKHLNEEKPKREMMTPTLLNTVVVLWLRSIHPSLPALVKQKYSTELRNRTLATLREDISESLDSMLAELGGDTAASIARSSYFNNSQRKTAGGASNQPYRQKSPRFCPICDANHRPTDHFLSECPYLPEGDRKFMSSRARARAIEAGEKDELEELWHEIENLKMKRVSGSPPSIHKDKPDHKVEGSDSAEMRKVTMKSSPCLQAYYKKHPVKITVDSGAEANMMKEACAKRLGVTIYRTTSEATQADGISDMDIVGEVHLVFRIGHLELAFDGLVSRDLSDDVLAGVPFMAAHDVYARPAKKLVYIGDQEFKCTMISKSSKAEMMRVPRKTALLPGDSIKLPLPLSMVNEEEVAVEPRLGAQSLRGLKFNEQWLHPQVVTQEDGCVMLTNESCSPVLINRHEQIAIVRPVTTETQSNVASSMEESKCSQSSAQEATNYKDVSIDPDGILNPEQYLQFQKLNEEFQEVFDGRTLGLYNGASGPLEVVINMGPTLPPQRKGKMPLYGRSLLEEQQKICDELEGTVLLKPEEENITVEYLNPSFLVRKPSGKKRFVTAFGEVGQYSKPQPALMPDLNGVILQIGNYKYVIKTDLTGAYWQMRLSKDSMRYCGVATPFKGVRVYGRGAMGMPGTETALEEMLSRVLGDLLTEGGVTKVADDIYCGGQTPEEALSQWKRVLQALKVNGLRLSAAKTVICPRSTSLLGWVWEAGTIRASPHKVSALAALEPPATVGGMRSYIGGFKYNGRVMKAYHECLDPLEEVVAGRKSQEKIVWTDSLHEAYKRSQKHVESSEAIVIPRRDDQLQVITDASKSGMGAGLYVLRDGKAEVAGYFSSRYKQHQTLWMPCETEALAISAAITHFAPYILNSTHQTLVMTDSLPCVQAFNRLRKGQFSSSARVSTFLSVVCRFNVHLAHVKGSENIYADFASRNAAECTDRRCQICKFIQETSDSVVRACTVKEVLEATTPVPYSSRSGWFELQLSDESLRRACAHLKQGTKPSKKSTDMKDVKRYLQVAKIARDGLLIVEQYTQSVGRSERIIVPRAYLHALLECLHLKLQHPSKLQLQKVFSRAYYALNLDAALEVVSKSCHTCTSLADMPNRFLQQTTTTSPTAVGSNFASDVVKRSTQSILIMREYVSSYTAAKLIWNEKASSLRTAMIILGGELLPSTGQPATVKVDPASACRSLKEDSELKRNGMSLMLGHPKYKNKIPVADRAIRELHSELNRILEPGAIITEKILSKAVQNMNCRLRGEGLSAREIWTKRDQFSGAQIPVDDLLLIRSQEEKKSKSHIPSATFKARGKTSYNSVPLKKGDLVYVNSDRQKTQARDRYVVTGVASSTCQVQKFTGMQLRARSYTVNRADITVVQPWKFTDSNEESDDEDENTFTEVDKDAREDVAADIPAIEVEDREEEDDEEDEASSEVESESEDIEEEVVTRSGRKVRRPERFKDYTLFKN